MRRSWLPKALPLLLLLVVVACGGGAPVIDPGDGGNPAFDLTPADFVAGIDHPFLPYTPGSHWVYEGGGEHIEVTVLEETRVVMGITATVVRDTVTDSNGELVEDTYDWYAQDAEGNVWYLGEDTTEYANGVAVSHAGAWEAGVDGAIPGIVMPADPQPGFSYRQEYYKGEAEDLGRIDGFEDGVVTPFGSFDGALVTTEWTPLSPHPVEQKLYAEGIGLVLERTIRGSGGTIALVSFDPGG